MGVIRLVFERPIVGEDAAGEQEPAAEVRLSEDLEAKERADAKREGAGAVDEPRERGAGQEILPASGAEDSGSDKAEEVEKTEKISVQCMDGEIFCSFSLDDIARTIGLTFSEELIPTVELLGFEGQVYPVPTQEHAVRRMIHLPALVQVLERFNSEGQAVLDWLEQEPKLEHRRAEIHRLRYRPIDPKLAKQLQETTSMMQLNPNVTVAEIGEAIGVSMDQADRFFRHARQFIATVHPIFRR
ncbi:hypothetical protein [Burkholderia sp. Ac-20365]|uniref:hypothetical protein n=1 Tax=Burkholderia sp. Ac-20365 TaxID=2703897 RepID=UPI00197C7A98|nr:hypothetical protein [Burkholderia sp. Ac-20365]MBN3761087.1 hypothetical protein [Burkholderia sp. Ac-20365]